MTMSSSIAFVCEFHVLLLLTPHLPGECFKIISESLSSFPPSLFTFFPPSPLPSANTELQIAVGIVVSEGLSEDMSERMLEEKIRQKECLKICPK